MPKYVKNTTLPSLLDLVSPHSCRGCGALGSPLCNRCKNYILNSHKPFCPNCKTIISSYHTKCPNCKNLPLVYTVSNRNGLLGDLIHDYKYYSIRALARPLAELLSAILPMNLPNNSILVPLPTASHHIRMRGLDHTYLISKHLAKLRQLDLERILIRNRNTVQVGADRSTRLSQASLAYTLNPKIAINPQKTYILFDDVWTTGASILAAKNLLEKLGAKNIIIALLAYSS